MAKSGKRRTSRKTTRAKTSGKAARKAAPKARVKAGASAGAKASAAAPTPVTLEEAQALARARRPKLAARAVRRAAAPPASPEPVGRERQRLEKARREEIANRVREYKDTMSIMKARGARRPRKAAAKGRKAAVPKGGEAFTPLQVFAEGDSWFHYPAHFFKGGIIPRLQSRLGVPILSLATAGDEVRFMLGVEQRILLTQHLKNGCPAGGPWDVLLFSGGGNDIVDNPMALWVKDFNPAVPAEQLIHQARFDTALALVRAGYEDLIELRDRFSPTTHLVFHGYDFAIPNGKGVCGFGPWLEPTFALRKFPNMAARQKVVNAMLKQFARMLAALALLPRITFINGQGLLSAQDWDNELHPSSDGFDEFADLFHEKLKKLFPTRVA